MNFAPSFQCGASAPAIRKFYLSHRTVTISSIGIQRKSIIRLTTPLHQILRMTKTMAWCRIANAGFEGIQRIILHLIAYSSREAAPASLTSTPIDTLRLTQKNHSAERKGNADQVHAIELTPLYPPTPAHFAEYISLVVQLYTSLGSQSAQRFSYTVGSLMLYSEFSITQD